MSATETVPPAPAPAIEWEPTSCVAVDSPTEPVEAEPVRLVQFVAIARINWGVRDIVARRLAQAADELGVTARVTAVRRGLRVEASGPIPETSTVARLVEVAGSARTSGHVEFSWGRLS